MSAERPDALTDADTEALPSAGARLAPYLYPALTLAGLVVAWEAFTKLTAVSRLLLPAPSDIAATRSEEHTSELQSLAYLVCRLLLEKKKKRTEPTITVIHDNPTV